MQFFKGELRLEDLYYRDRDAVQVVARKLNSKYWLSGSVFGLHVIVSRVTIGMAIFLVMYEGQDADITRIDSICRAFVTEIGEQSRIERVEHFIETIAYSEITPMSFS